MRVQITLKFDQEVNPDTFPVEIWADPKNPKPDEAFDYLSQLYWRDLYEDEVTDDDPRVTVEVD